jgi:hypothetical protein
MRRLKEVQKPRDGSNILSTKHSRLGMKELWEYVPGTETRLLKRRRGTC